MAKKISNLEVLSEIHRRIKDKSVTPICKTEKFLQNALHTGTTYLLNKPYILIKNSKRKLKEKIFEGLKETKKNIDELSFKTTFKDYKNGLFELNFMPSYCRIHPDLEDSIFGENGGRFGSLMALLTDLCIGLGLGMSGLPDRDIKPYLAYIGTKALSHGSSAFYEYFRKIKQELESKNPS